MQAAQVQPEKEQGGGEKEGGKATPTKLTKGWSIKKLLFKGDRGGGVSHQI
jgi:hypothetical protein